MDSGGASIGTTTIFRRPESADLLSTLQKPGADTLRAAIAWLESQRATDRIFLWIHLFEPHDPYEPPEPYASRYRDRPYDGEVAYADTLVGQLDDALERLGLKSETLLVVASDHGEGLGEHQETLHGFFVYQTTLAVPLILRGPGIVGGGQNRRQRRARRSAADGARSAGRRPSTRLSALGQQPRPQRSAGGTGPTPDSPQYAESLVPLLHFGWSDLRVLRRGSWKYVLAPKPELYDLASDPHEQRNLADEQPARAAALPTDARERCSTQERRIGTTATARDAAGRVARTTRRPRLCRAAIRSTTATSGADPKDKILEFRQANQGMRDGILALNRRDYAAAARGVRGIDWQRHRELRGAPVSRPIAGGHEARRSRGGAFRAGGATGAVARRGVDGLGRSASGDRRTGVCARDRSRGPQTESGRARGSRYSTPTCAFACGDPAKRWRRSKPLSRFCPRMPRSASDSASSSAISGRSTPRSPAFVRRSPSTRPMRRPGTRSA